MTLVKIVVAEFTLRYGKASFATTYTEIVVAEFTLRYGKASFATTGRQVTMRTKC